MIRISLEVVTLFLLPTVVYLAFKLLTVQPGTQMSVVIARAPVVVLSLIGACLVGGVLALVGHEDGGKPGQTYQPAEVKDGRLIPGRIK